MESRGRNRLLILPFLAWFVFAIVGPFGLILANSFARRTDLGTLEHVFDPSSYFQLFDPLYASILLRTLGYAVANTVLCILMAYPVSFYLSRQTNEKRQVLLTLILIPFWTNFLVRVLAFSDLLRLRPFGLEWLYTHQGVLAALVYNYLPFAILPLYSSMCAVPSSVLEAAQDLGATRRQIFLHVLWPLTRQGTVAASLLVFIPTLGEFLIPDLIGGGRYFVLGTFLQNQFLTARNWPLGSAAIILLTLLTLFVMAFFSAGLTKHERKAKAL